MLNPGDITTQDRAEATQHPISAALRTDELDYELPERLIATRPIDGRRDDARMMVIRRSDPESNGEHRHVRDLPAYVSEGDALVFNSSAVVRARLAGSRIAPKGGRGGRVEGLFLSEITGVQDSSSSAGGKLWLVMLRSNGRLRPADRIALVDAAGEDAGVTLELLERVGAEWIVRVHSSAAPGVGSTELLERIGRTPLPPYILRARGKQADIPDTLDRDWYETVYADPSMRRSVAAPTAGLHFTPELLSRLDERGVSRLNVVLHVGAGTFQPVKAPTLAEHRIHAEWFEVPRGTLDGLKHAKRVIAVGTTAVRTLESLPSDLGKATGVISGTTDLMIATGHTFRHVDGLLTNFHLPRSTLLALVAAAIGLERLKHLYRDAIAREYRFFSYGDCMLILP